MSHDVLVCGVGGQGVLLASEVIAHAALAAGLDAKKSEVHGMAQRGGSVESHVRFGERVASPLIEAGRAGVLLGCEAMEALRARHFLAPGGVAVYSTRRVVPPSIREEQYPTDIAAALGEVAGRVFAVPSLEIALELGEPRVENVVLLGALSRVLELSEAHWHAALERCVPERALAVNRDAFARGRELV